jgi:acylphosphatase
MSQSCIRCLIAGRVQGVWYRSSARARAVQLGLTGYARNLPDGRVEVLACGDPSVLALFREWLGEGPPAAQVSAVSCQAVSPSEAPGGFTTR